MSEKKELDIKELEKVSGGAQGHIIVVGIVYYKENASATSLIAREVYLNVPADTNSNNYGDYAEQFCNEKGYLYDHFEFEGVLD